MIEILELLKAWHWMLLGIVLLGFETLGARGYLVGAGVAAFVTCLVALSDVGWQVQFGIFIFLSVFFTIIYFKKLRKRVVQQAALLQARLAAQISHTETHKSHPLIGKIGIVIQGNSMQTAKARVADRIWEIRCKQVLELNDEVRVRSCHGKVLHVSKLV